MARSTLDMTSRIAPVALAHANARGLDEVALLKKHELPADLDWKSAGKLEVTLPLSRLTALRASSFRGRLRYRCQTLTFVSLSGSAIREN